MIVRAIVLVADTVGTTAGLEGNGNFIASYSTDGTTVGEKLTTIFADYSDCTYYKVGKRQRNDRKG